MIYMYNKNKTLPHPFIIIIVICTPPTSILHISATIRPDPNFGKIGQAVAKLWAWRWWLGEGVDLFLCCVQPLLTFHFLGTWNGDMKKEELWGTFDYFSILICNLWLATFYFQKALEPLLKLWFLHPDTQICKYAKDGQTLHCNCSTLKGSIPKNTKTQIYMLF